MEVLDAKAIKKFSNWTAFIYSEPEKGKTTMVKNARREYRCVIG